MIGKANFQAYQIVYLEYQDSRLYAEVIQAMDCRRVIWARPLMLVKPPASINVETDVETLGTEVIISDLRQTADLLWPTALFQPALDLDVVPLLTKLLSMESYFDFQSDRLKAAQYQLKYFTWQLWQAHPKAFHGLGTN